MATCTMCGSVMVETTVLDTVHTDTDPGGLSGGGDVKARVVEHCPNCNPNPQSLRVERSTHEDLM